MTADAPCPTGTGSAPRVKQPGGRADASKVTLVEPSPVAGPARTAVGGRAGLAWLARLLREPTLEHVLVLALLATVVFPLAHAGGGRAAGALAWAALPAVAAVVVTRPWQRLAAPPLVAVAAVAVAALLVLALTGGGRDAGVAALSYGVVLACGLVVVAYGRTPARRAVVATVVCAGGVAQFAWALVPWWGAADPSRPMVGTYDWHNQFAAALIAPALLGLGLLLAGRRPWRSAGWIAAPLAGAGVVLSTSRASLGLLVLGWLLVAVLAWVGTPAGRRRSGVASRALVVTVLTVAVTFVLPGPPLFSASASPLAGASQRSQSGETIDANSTYRTEFWRESLVAFRQHPVAGAGFGRTAADTSGHVPTSWAVSSLAHSGPLQALADGGLLLAVPLLVLLVGVGVGLLRRLRPRAEPADDPHTGGADGEGAGYWRGADHVLVPAAVVTSAVLAVHALVDTDWSYPALAAQAAIVAGVALALPRRGDMGRPVGSPLGLTACAALVGALVVGLLVAWGQPFHINAPQTSATTTTSGGGHS